MSTILSMQTAYLPLSQALQINPKLSNLEAAQLLCIIHPQVHLFSLNGKQSGLYSVSPANEVSLFDEGALKGELVTYLNVSQKKADDMILAYKGVFSPNMLALGSVSPVAFSDPSNTPPWKRLPFTEESTALVTPDDIPEYMEFVSRINEQDRDYLTLWLGSLLDYSSDKAQYIHLKGEGGDGKFYSRFFATIPSFFSQHLS